MALDPDMQGVLDLLTQLPVIDLDTLDPLEAARLMRAQQPARPLETNEDGLRTVDAMVPCGVHGVPVRLYRQEGNASTGLLVNLHGGGWAMGSLDSDDARCRRLAHETGAAVVSVDYRLTPEHPFPAAYDDSLAAVRWAWTHRCDVAGWECPVALEGSSAGANLVAAVALALRDPGGPQLALQVMISPVCNDDFATDSYRNFGCGHFLTRDMMRWFWDQYVPAGRERDGRSAVLRALSVERVAPAHILVAECDPLRDEGLAYARRLEASGVPVQLELYRGALHSFTTLAPASALADRAFRAIGVSVRKAFAG